MHFAMYTYILVYDCFRRMKDNIVFGIYFHVLLLLLLLFFFTYMSSYRLLCLVSISKFINGTLDVNFISHRVFAFAVYVVCTTT